MGGPTISAPQTLCEHFPRRARLVSITALIMVCVLVSPAWSTVAVADDGTGSNQYQVQPGDTLSQVALDHGLSQVALARVNGLANVDLLYAGSLLTIPGPGPGASGAGDGSATRYTVAAGDNLIGIAQRFNTSPGAIAMANGLSDQNLVVIGTTLSIPSGGGSSAAAPIGVTPNGGSDVSSSSTSLSSSFDRWAAFYGVPADLLKADALLESGWQPNVVSPDGAIGIGQLLPDTVEFMRMRIGIPLDPWVADDNIRMSAALMRLLLDETGWDVDRTLAAYYQGLASLRARGPYGESIAYARLVESLRSRF